MTEKFIANIKGPPGETLVPGDSSLKLANGTELSLNLDKGNHYSDLPIGSFVLMDATANAGESVNNLRLSGGCYVRAASGGNAVTGEWTGLGNSLAQRTG